MGQLVICGGPVCLFVTGHSVDSGRLLICKMEGANAPPEAGHENGEEVIAGAGAGAGGQANNDPNGLGHTQGRSFTLDPKVVARHVFPDCIVPKDPNAIA